MATWDNAVDYCFDVVCSFVDDCGRFGLSVASSYSICYTKDVSVFAGVLSDSLGLGFAWGVLVCAFEH